VPLTAGSPADVDVFHAVADVNRRRLIDALRAGERPVGDLVDEVGLSYSAVSQHLKILHRAGLVQRRADGLQRIYRLDAAPLHDVHRWTEQYRTFWTSRLARLHRYVGDQK
jgi:DNA-binding transcriptional ArsR family regulator